MRETSGRNGGGGGAPAAREKFHQLIHGVSVDAGQHVAEVVKRVDGMALTGGDEGEEDGGGVTAVFGSQERPVAAAHGDAAQGAFGGIVVDGQIAPPRIGGVDAQRLPLVEGVGDRGAHGALGEHGPAACGL